MVVAASYPLKIVIGGVDKISKPLGRTLKKVNAFGRGMQSMGRNMTRSMTLPIVGLGVLAFRAAADFETGMLRIQAVTGKTGMQLDSLRMKAEALGAKTIFSAGQVAEAMAILAKAGLSPKEIEESIEGVLNLAAATELEIPEAAIIATAAVFGFRKEMSEMDSVIDKLTKTANLAPTNIMEIGEAMKDAAPAFAGAGRPMSEALAVLDALAQRKFVGTLGGGAIKSGFRTLALLSNTTKAAFTRLGIRRDEVFDETGNMRNFIDILERLQLAGAGRKDLADIFGGRAFLAFEGLIQSDIEAIRELQRRIEDSEGVAQSMADTMMSGATGALAEWRAATEALGISLGKAGLLQWMTDAIDATAEWSRGMSSAKQETLGFALKLGLVLAVLGPLTTGVGTLIVVLTPIYGLLILLNTALGAMASLLLFRVIPAVWGFTLALLANPITMIIGLIALLIIAGVALVKNWEKVKTFLLEIWGSIVKELKATGELIMGFFDGIADGIVSVFKTAFGWIQDKLAAAVGWLPDWVKDRLGFSTSVKVSGPGTFDGAPRGRPGGTVPPPAGGGESMVRVRFDNVPPGVKVDVERDDLGIDVQLGPSMGM